jgi:hypothetical protein
MPRDVCRWFVPGPLIAAAALGPAAPAEAVVKTWNNALGGDWTTGTNWTPNGQPQAADDVVITLAGVYTVQILGIPISVNSVTLGGASGTQTLNMVGADSALTLAAPSTINANGVFQPRNVTLNGLGTQLTNNGLIHLLQRTVTWSGPGQVSNGATGWIRIEAAGGTNSSFTFSGSVTNAGLIVLHNTGPGLGDCTLALASGTLTNSPGGTIQSAAAVGMRTITARINNQGTLDVDYELTVNGTSADHLNSGTIDISGGDLIITQSGTTPTFTNSGPITIATNQDFRLTGGTFTYNGGAISGTGLLLIDTVTLALGSSLTNELGESRPGTLWLVDSTVNGPGTLINQGRVLMDNVDINAPFTNESGGDVDVVLGTGNRFDGAFNNMAGAALEISASASGGNRVLTIADGSSFTQSGLLTLDQTNGTPWDVRLIVTSGTLTNEASGEIRSEGSLGTRTIEAAIDNQGTITVGYPLTINRASADHTSSGDLFITGGNLTITQSGTTPTFTNTGDIVLNPGGVLAVSAGAVIHSAGGTILGSGTLQLSGATLLLGEPLVTSDARLILNGACTVFGPGSLTVINTIAGVDLDLTSDTINAPLLIEPAAQVAAGAGCAINAQLDNQGIVTVTGAAAINHPSADHTSSGAINVTGGDLTITQSGTTPTFTNLGTITVQVFRDLAISGGEVHHNGGMMTGSGSLALMDAVLHLGAGHDTGDLSVALNGVCSVNGPATLTVSDRLTLGFDTINAPLVLANGGVLEVFDSSSINGTLAMTSAATGIELIGPPAVVLSVANGFTNEGTITFYEKGGMTGPTLAVASGTLINEGTIETIESGSHTLAAQIENRGAILVHQDLTIAKPSADHVNTAAGTIVLTTGDLTIEQTGTTPTFDNLGSIEIQPGMVLDVNGGTFTNAGGTGPGGGLIGGEGTLDVMSGTPAVFTNAATVAPGSSPGTFSFDGTFTQNAQGGIYIEIGGESAGQYDTLDVDGPLALSGTLTIEYINGYEPEVCQPGAPMFVIITADSVDGLFSSVVVINGPPVNVTHGAMSVSVTPFDDVPPEFPSGCQGATVNLDPVMCEAMLPDLTMSLLVEDNCGVVTSVTQDPAAGTIISADTFVTISATDDSGNTGTCQATVTAALPYTGPASGSWLVEPNWECGGIPTAMDSVYIPTTVIVDGPGAVADMIRITGGAAAGVGGSLEIGDGTLEATSIFVEGGAALIVDHPDAVLTVDSLTVIPGATFTWTAGTIIVREYLTVPGDLEIGCVGEPCTLELVTALANPTGVIEVCPDGVLKGTGTLLADVENCGVLELSAATGTLGSMAMYAQSGCAGRDGSDSGALRVTLQDSGSAGAPALQTFNTGLTSLGGLLEVNLAAGVDPLAIENLRILNGSSLIAGREAFDLALLPALAHPAAIAVDTDARAGDVVLDSAELFFDLAMGGAGGLDIDEVPIAIVADDFDGDGDVDMAIGLPGNPGGIRVLRNNGMSIFPANQQTQQTGGSDPNDLARGQFNGDNAPDLAMANGNGTISIFINNGVASFTETTILSVGADDLAVGRFDADGRDDIIVAQTALDRVVIITQPTTGSFTAGTTIDLPAAGAGPVRVEPAAIDAPPPPTSNLSDFIVLAGEGDSVGIYLNDGDGTFTLDVFRPLPDEPAALAVADLDGDGLDEVITASRSPLDPLDQVSILVNRSGAPMGGVNAPIHLDLGAAPRAIVAADLDGDASGDLDLVILADDAGGDPVLRVIRNDSDLAPGTVAIVPVSEVPVSAGAFACVAADLDGHDGPDLVTINAPPGSPSSPRGRRSAGPPSDLSIVMNSTVATPACPGDCAGAPGLEDGTVNVTDLLALLAQWSMDGACDLNNDNVVNVTDLLALLAAWGPCPP